MLPSHSPIRNARLAPSFVCGGARCFAEGESNKAVGGRRSTSKTRQSEVGSLELKKNLSEAGHFSGREGDRAGSAVSSSPQALSSKAHSRCSSPIAAILNRSRCTDILTQTGDDGGSRRWIPACCPACACARMHTRVGVRRRHCNRGNSALNAQTPGPARRSSRVCVLTT
jgi:hypothetical protein